MRRARAAHAVVASSTAVYALAGTGAGGAPVLPVERFEVLRVDDGASAWQTAPPTPTARNFARAVSFRDRIHVVGGSPTPGRSHASEGSGAAERFGLRYP